MKGGAIQPCPFFLQAQRRTLRFCATTQRANTNCATDEHMPLTRLVKRTGVKTKTKRLRLTTLVAGALCACVVAVAPHADEGSEPKPVKAFRREEHLSATSVASVTQTTAVISGKGPQLMDNPNSDAFHVQTHPEGQAWTDGVRLEVSLARTKSTRLLCSFAI